MGKPSKYNSKMLPPSHYAGEMQPSTMDLTYKKTLRMRGASTMDLPPTVLKPSKYNSKMLPPSHYAGGMQPSTMDLPTDELMYEAMAVDGDAEVEGEPISEYEEDENMDYVEWEELDEVYDMEDEEELDEVYDMEDEDEIDDDDYIEMSS